MQNLKNDWSAVSKMTGIWWILTRILEVSKICTSIGSYCTKYLMFDLKKYRGVIFHYTEKWCKIWRKTDLWFGKLQEEFGKFSTEHSKMSKLGLSWDSFVQSRKCMSLKFTAELCVMTMKKRNWLVISKLTSEIWQILTRANENLKNLLFNWLLWPKYMFELKMYREVMFDGNEDLCKIWKKTDLCFQKWHEEFGKFA